jgi:NAD(P)-dependent dehydrogenase (short-subunit alcohol dehydrogenase family)
LSKDKKRVAVVTGANRGIGLEFVHQLLDGGWEVVAGFREEGPSKQLLSAAEKSPRLHPVKLDVVREDDTEALKEFVSRRFAKLDLLINNAGISSDGKADVDDVDVAAIGTDFDVNVIGPLLVTRKLHSLLAKGLNPRVVNIGSRLGSVELSTGSIVPYRLSKAALNMLTKIQAEAYGPEGIIVVVVSPGWVRTDMGGRHANLSPEESVSAMLEQIEQLTPDRNGAFFGLDGSTIPY